MRVFRTVALGGVVASAIAVMASGMAAADPPAGVTPANADIVAVGSNTIQALFNTWSTHYNATAPTAKLYSFDATGTATVNEKAATACHTIVRPNGSGAGIAALNTGTVTGDGHTCVDIGRSSR